MLGEVVDVFRVRQYFNGITRLRQVGESLREDGALLDAARRAVVTLPFDRTPPRRTVLPRFRARPAAGLKGRRVGVIATGGSGALASLVGVARALEEAEVRPSVMSVCSGSALFGFPLAAGLPADRVAEATAALQPKDYIDLDWRQLARLLPTAARGFSGVVKGDRLEEWYTDLLGERRLGELQFPCYAPIWNVEHNRLDYIGPTTYPDMTVAHAVRMAIALILFIRPVELDRRWWADGGIVDIFPVHPVLELEPTPELVFGLNGFYPPGFVGEDVTGWLDKRFSILDAASQVRTCQQQELARVNLARLQMATEVVMLEPVPYDKVRGAGFYRQFLDTAEWPAFMRAGREATHRALAEVAAPAA